MGNAITHGSLPEISHVPVSNRDAGKFYEVVNGQRVEVSPMGAWAGLIASELLALISSFAKPRNVGFAMVEVLFQMRPGRPQRRPDLAFVARDRWPLSAMPTEDPPALEVVPNLAVEVVSPTNTAVEVFGKVQEYFEAGVQLVWVVYPLQRSIQVFESPNQSRVLREGDELDGGAVLPGFRLRLSQLFGSAAGAN
jgi:Uma2 family endonuclease